MFLEIAAEEAGVGKLIFPCYLLDALLAVVELHLYLQRDVLVYDGLWGMARDLFHYICKVFGRDVHELGVVLHISGEFVVALHELHEEVEELSHTV